MKFRPLHDRVVVKRIDAEEKSAGGIRDSVLRASASAVRRRVRGKTMQQIRAVDSFL
jgi:co-chaperonin GroES (HSP10)